MKNSRSVFPNQIDPLIFFSDINIDQVPTMESYYNLLYQNNFSQASNLLNNSDCDFYGAYVLNLIENCLYAIESNAETFIGDKPHLADYGEEQPTGDVALTWAGYYVPGAPLPVGQFIVDNGKLLCITDWDHDLDFVDGDMVIDPDAGCTVSNGVLNMVT